MAKKISASVGKGGRTKSTSLGLTDSSSDSNSASDTDELHGEFNFLMEISGGDAGAPDSDPGGFRTDPGYPGADAGSRAEFDLQDDFDAP